MDLWGLVGYECYGQVVLPHGLSSAILIMPPPTQIFALETRIASHNLIFDQTKYNPNQLIFQSNNQN